METQHVCVCVCVCVLLFYGKVYYTNFIYLYSLLIIIYNNILD